MDALTSLIEGFGTALTPQNRMKAPVASTLKVIGSSSAMVSAGPMPGSTPIAVPSSTPSSANIRFVGVSAVPNPSMSEEIASIRGCPSGCRPAG